MRQKKQFKDLDLCNAFLFSAALEDEEICRLVISRIIGRPLKKVKVRSERSILFNSDFRSVRLDVYATEETMVAYNLEMQQGNEYNLPKRCRYHQAEMDLSSLKPGEDFNCLQPSYIIFICTFDPFKEKLYRYTFEKRCMERDIPFGDETHTIVLNTEGKNAEEVPDELIHFLRYVVDSTGETAEETQDSGIKMLHEKVTELKKSRELEERHMWLEEYVQNECKEACKEVREEAHKIGLEEGRIEGRAEGRAEGHIEGHIEGHVQGRVEGHAEGHIEGRDFMMDLVIKMLKDGRADEIEKCKTDSHFLEEMIQKYGVK